MTAPIDIASDYTAVFDGPLYVHSERVERALRPHLPSSQEMSDEFRARLRQRVDGVKILELPPSNRAAHGLLVGKRDGSGALVETRYQRRKAYAKMLVENEVFEVALLAAETADETQAARYREGASEEVRKAAFAVADAFADRVARQVGELRAEIGADAPVIVSCVGDLPRILGDNAASDSALFIRDDNTDAVGCVFGAYYFVTPVSDTPTTNSPS